ncbi:cytoplasmic dynein 1 intermediate chain 1-like isoform X3 [Mercenaria mercenaria]|uniref:cytoplasmic dynein 1 intermediate chain 1-like isoform X3 n=1 Tax=Mercenaria mercenaria TaxID=6596 RepID=UPI00234FA879|nr:cytoplasmic dynein 1 intermediate chain 1-like isoform X3 [Mercenaria mercenaria]
MSDRKAELERKKAKLEMMRKERQEKERIRKMKEQTEETKPQVSQSARDEADKLLQDLGIPPAGETAESSTPSDKGSESTDGSKEPTPHPTPTKTGRGKTVKLAVAKVSETNIPPRENVTYSKETQTVGLEPPERDGHGGVHHLCDGLSDTSSPSHRSKLGSHGSPRHYGSPRFHGSDVGFEWDDEFSYYDEDDDQEPDTDSIDISLGTMQHPHKMPHVEMVAPSHTAEDKPPVHLRELSEEEKSTILLSEEFRSFMDHTSRIVERALDEVDVDIDYSRSADDELSNQDLAGERLKVNREFFDERWSKHRIVTSLDWSTQFPELLVASYSANEDAPHDPDGVALIWNSRFKKNTPEYVFHCQSAVMSSCFAKFHPNLVVGGTYSGQIVLWDNRVLKRTPIQRTPLSASAHTHPVYCVNVVGTQNAHNLISVSTDGKMCSWSLDMLSQPQDCMELQQHKQSRAVNVTSFSFLSGDVNNFVVGSEDCSVYAACRHGSKAGVSEIFEGHQGPVTGIDCHKVAGQIDFSPYFLTSSFDWTIKLWSMKDNKFIHSFEDNSDYVYDVQWSPIHPALFASVDGMARLDLWNLNQDTEVPSASVSMDTGVALNHLRWHQSGHTIAVADDMGHIYNYDVAESFANPKSDEWSRFVQTLQELRQHAAEREEDTNLAGLSSPLR